MRFARLLLVGSLLAGSSARAQGPATGGSPHATTAERDASSYCRWVKAVAASNADPLVAPSVYASGGYTSAAEGSPGASGLPPTQRLVVAGLYSVGGLNRGLAMRAQADAECKRYATTAELRAFVERNRDAESVRALRAKAKVLDEAVPRAEEVLAAQRTQLAASRLTVEEVDGTQIRTDTLRALATETRQRVEALAALPPAPGRSYREALAQRDAAEAEAEREEGRVRASSGWDIVLRGGYDRIFGVRDDTPLFAMATISVNLGWFFQGSANGDALDARREWVRAEVEGLDDRVEQVAARLRAVRNGEVARLRETTVLLSDLEARLKSVSSIGGEKARAYADYVWFDLVRMRAEHAYYAEHVRELSEMLGESGGNMSPSSPRRRLREGATALSILSTLAALAACDRAERSAPPVEPSTRIVPAATEVSTTAADAPSGGAKKLQRVAPDGLCVTSGEIVPLAGGRFTVNAPTFRAVTAYPGDARAELRFTYLGPTATTRALGSGAVRRQLGLKLRAQDPCNLVYVMWRIEPESKLVVSIKQNPGERTSRECGNLGYRNLKPRASAPVPAIAPGSSHVLRAEMNGDALQVSVDDVAVWEGALGPEAAALAGPIGVRTDNVHLEAELSGAASGGAQPCGPGETEAGE